jgi:hypothetical protein
VPGRATFRRATGVGALLTTLTAAAAVGGAPAATAQTAPAPKPPQVIRVTDEGFVSRLGPVRVVGRRPSLPNAYRAFGRPSSERGKRNVRYVGWRAAGVSITGATFGLCRRSRCRTDELYVQSARVTGPRWQTAEGLRVGDPAARLTELYDLDVPGDGSGEVVVADAYYPVGGDGDIPTVTARIRDGVVKGFDVWVGGAGE